MVSAAARILAACFPLPAQRDHHPSETTIRRRTGVKNLFHSCSLLQMTGGQSY